MKGPANMQRKNESDNFAIIDVSGLFTTIHETIWINKYPNIPLKLLFTYIFILIQHLLTVLT